MRVSDLQDGLGGAANVLLSTGDGDRTDAACADLVTPGTRTNLVVVTVDAPPDQRLAALQHHLDGSPDNGVVIAAGDAARSNAEERGDGYGAPVRWVDHPADLTSLGIELSDAIREFPDSSVVACFDSLTGLLAHSDLERTFRFLHVVTNRLATVDARGHFHMDPTAHDEQTVDTLTALFDAVVERNGDDELTVRTR